MSEEGMVSTAPEVTAEVVIDDQNPTKQATVEPAKGERTRQLGRHSNQEESEAETDVTETAPDPVKDAEAEVRKGKNREARRIDKLHRERAEAVARGDLLQRQVDDFQAKARPAVQDGAPKLEDFNDIESYAEAVAKFRIGEHEKGREQNQRQASAQQLSAQLRGNWDKQVDVADGKYDDFHAKVGGYIPDPSVPWSRAIMAADNGADIAYYLQENFKEAQRIASLDPFSQVREIGKLEQRLGSQTPAARRASQAPSPIKPLSGGSTNTDKQMSELSYDEHVASRKKYIANKR